MAYRFLPSACVEIWHLALLPLQAAEPHVRLVAGQLHGHAHRVGDRLEGLYALVLGADDDGEIVEEAQVGRPVHVEVAAIGGVLTLEEIQILYGKFETFFVSLRGLPYRTSVQRYSSTRSPCFVTFFCLSCQSLLGQ